MRQTLKDLLEKAWCIYRRNFVHIAVAILLIWIPLILIQLFLIEPSLDIEGLSKILENKDLVGTAEYEEALLVSMRSTSIYMIATLLLSFLGLVSDIVVIKTADKSVKIGNGKIESSFSDIFSESIPALPRCLWIVILTAIFVAIGVMLFVLPGLYIYVMSSLAVTAAVLIGVKGMTAIKLSSAVVKKEFFTIVVVLIATIVVNSILVSIFDLIALPLPDNKIVSYALNGTLMLAEKFVMAFQIVLFTVFFTERYKKISNGHGQGTDPAAAQ